MESPKKILSKASSIVGLLMEAYPATKVTKDFNKITDSTVKMIQIGCACVAYTGISFSFTPSDCDNVSNPNTCTTYSAGGACDPYIVPSSVTWCSSYTVEDLNRLLESQVPLKTIKTTSAETRDKIVDYWSSIEKTYTPKDGHLFLKNFSNSLNETLTKPTFLTKEKSLSTQRPTIQHVLSIVKILSDSVESMSNIYCPCVDNSFELRGGCVGLSDCGTQSVCFSYSRYKNKCTIDCACDNKGGIHGCWPKVHCVGGCRCDTVCSNDVWVCPSKSLCSKNICPCNCFGFVKNKGYTCNTDVMYQ